MSYFTLENYVIVLFYFVLEVSFAMVRYATGWGGTFKEASVTANLETIT
jgi:hypothetical protein